MKHSISRLIIITLPFLLSLTIHAENFLFDQNTQKEIIINNRILAKVNGKPISVMDVIKKMDVHFYKQFPEYTHSTAARFQFYQMSWKQVLQDVIDKQLILEDAEENKLPVSLGDVRQEMENLFGPNIIFNLDKVGLSFDDAQEVVKGDITLRRMLYARVGMKAQRQVTPEAIRKAYEDYSKENIRPTEYEYLVISIRDADPLHCERGAQIAYHQFTQEGLSPEQLKDQFINFPGVNLNSKLTISELFTHKESDVSENYKEILASLTQGDYSQPILQQSRDKNSTLYRIFYLKDKTAGGVIPFHEMELKLSDKLYDEAMVKESELYIKRLRQHFDVQEPYKNDLENNAFQPFDFK